MKIFFRVLSMALGIALIIGIVYYFNRTVDDMSLRVMVNGTEYTEDTDGVQLRHNTFVTVPESEYDVKVTVRKLSRDFIIKTADKEYQWSRLAKANADVTDKFKIVKAENGFSVDYVNLFDIVGLSDETITNMSELSSYSLFDMGITSKFDKLTIGFNVDLSENYITLNSVNNDLLEDCSNIGFTVNQDTALTLNVFDGLSLNCVVASNGTKSEKAYAQGVHTVYVKTGDIVTFELELTETSDGILDCAIQYDGNGTFICVANYDFDWYGKNYFNARSISFRAVKDCRVYIHNNTTTLSRTVYVNGIEGYVKTLKAGDTFSIRAEGRYAGHSAIITRYYQLSSLVSEGYIDCYNNAVDKLPDGSYDFTLTNYNFLIAI